MSMNLSWIIMAGGCMKGLMVTCGSLMSTITLGDLITTEDGFGIQSAGGHGARMSHGDGVFPIMADGTGESAWVGTGSRPGLGGQPGYTGIMESIISGGAR